eukprot:SAG31_NODE_3469_length_4238_cov_2.647741_1_plen_114_part_00
MDLSLQLLVAGIVGAVSFVGFLLYLYLSKESAPVVQATAVGNSMAATSHTGNGSASTPASTQHTPPAPLDAVQAKDQARSFAETCVAVGTAMSFEVKDFPAAVLVFLLCGSLG